MNDLRESRSPASPHPLGMREIQRRQAKLRWYKDGGCPSERQWNDLRNILRVQGNRLDRAYLSEWATILEVQDLLLKLAGE